MLDCIKFLQSDVILLLISPWKSAFYWSNLNTDKWWSELEGGKQGQIGTCDTTSVLFHFEIGVHFPTGLVRTFNQEHDEWASIKWIVKVQILAQLKDRESCLMACMDDTMSLPA